MNLRTATPARSLHNLILSALPDREMQNFLDHGQPLAVQSGDPLYPAGRTGEYVYFPMTALVSMLGLTQEGLSIETGMISQEGMVGLGHFLGNTTSMLQCVVQRRGEVYRMPVRLIRRKEMTELQRMLFLYSNYRLTELAQSALCNKFHRVRQRFCRWLLTAQDRTGNSEMEFTQDVLSAMLGARRPVVTALMGDLQNGGLIAYQRVSISLVNRPGLVQESCECYAVLAEAMRDYLGCLTTTNHYAS